MKKLKILITFVMAALLFGCSEDDSSSLDSLTNAAAPANISALFKITQDNTGTVTIIPKGEGVVNYEVHYGHGDEEPVTLNVGGTATHVYPEGNYTVKIIATGINGKKTEVDLPLTVSFLAPVDVVATVAPIPGNSFGVSLGATASLETFFTVDWGDGTPLEEFMEGETLTHDYAEVGTYTVIVTALSGGVANTPVTNTVTITNPLLLPITFENSTLNYAFTDFGGAVSAVVDNPDPSGINTSSKVGKMTPAAGQTWTGGYLTLDSPADLSANHFFRIRVWSPQSGVTVKLKLENLTDGNIAHEVDAVTTVANQWEELIYDFSGAGTTQEYSKIVLFFNAGNPGTGDAYYFDDIELISSTSPLELPLTFESALLDYTFTDFEGAASQLIDNPHVNAQNPSSKVIQVLKPNGSPVWAGSWILLDQPIDFTVNKKIKMKVWSPTAGIPVIVKFEQATNPAVNIERNVATTVANQWEEMTFDFEGINSANNYQKVVVFFNAGNAGTGETYYFDDIQLVN